ncbi:AAA family ATPase, partial [Acidobacteria bacterium AH-259-A15]|nr:AAA family ATPase [Acidobacteria bacterium AH-259-A15]
MRNDDLETDNAGKSWENLQDDQLPACVQERGSFMAPFEIPRTVSHPYHKTSQLHEHFRPTLFRQPPYSPACIPFRWMLKQNAEETAEELNIYFQPKFEPELGFRSAWVQDFRNQAALLDTFFGAIQPEESLCFFYAKLTPLSDDSRRVIVGVGRVKGVGECIEYRYSTPEPKLRSAIWDRTIQHSIRPNYEDGFLLPYHEVLEYSDKHPGQINTDDFLAFAPEEHWIAFSYGSEHVSHGAAILALLSCSEALDKIGNILPGDWQSQRAWIDKELNRLWKMRGPFPGLGSALKAFGIQYGNLIAYEIASAQAEFGEEWSEDPWQLVEQLLSDPSGLGTSVAKHIGLTYFEMWKSLPETRKELLKLLSRFELREEQATRFYQESERKRCMIDVADDDLLANPYLLYELDRSQPDPISLAIIDQGMFPDQVVLDRYPFSSPSAMDSPLDKRRVRAQVMAHLERAAERGHTLQPRLKTIQAVRDLNLQPPCPMSEDLLRSVEKFFNPLVRTIRLADKQSGFQLERLAEVGSVIRKTVERRIAGTRHAGEFSWRKLLDDALEDPVEAGDDEEKKAREEKASALQELFASRLSVLVGPAGSGKTTLLKVLCDLPEVRSQGISLLAPTGKARVQLETHTGIKGAKTIAQFLRPHRYDDQTGMYRLSNAEKTDAGKTVIIDEASMLTEEQLAAVLDGIKTPSRLILVGDPKQLPPIGAGRPFLDIVRWFRPANVDTRFPRISPGYAELTIQRRQKGQGRDDLLLADWFTGKKSLDGADEVWDRLQRGEPVENVRLVNWSHPDEIKSKLLDALVEELGLDSHDDHFNFEKSLGGSEFNGKIYFHAKRANASTPGAGEGAESWQVLSPVRGRAEGIEAINRLIQESFREHTRKRATQKSRRIPKPMGREGILYGDKVINTTNSRRGGVYPKEDALQYVANGEIGMVVGQYKGRNAKYSKLPWQLEVEFSSQPGYQYGYTGRDFTEEKDSTLELAYALTIHKAQGSEFGVTFVVLPADCWLLSRELLYTAFTRHRDRLIILHQGDLVDFRNYSSDHFSELFRRLTNLLERANPIETHDLLLEEGLIHRSQRGELMRSKSEVIIANLLFTKGIEYEYERRFKGEDGASRWPDFTIEDEEMGRTVYWEHLGMMSNPVYVERWRRKLKWYKGQGIVPFNEGDESSRILVITEDGPEVGIDVPELERLIDS